jgi:hypothetical protein
LAQTYPGKIFSQKGIEAMNQGFFRRYAASIVALALVLAAFAATRYPKLSPDETASLASHFRFTRMPLAELTNHPPYKSVREVHPSLQRISAWISSLGAAATLPTSMAMACRTI